VEYEIPLPEAFRLAGAASSDPIMATGAEKVHQDLRQGVPLAEALHGRGLVPEWVSWMTGLG
jgi:type II secretory pathway component PulF